MNWCPTIEAEMARDGPALLGRLGAMSPVPRARQSREPFSLAAFTSPIGASPLDGALLRPESGRCVGVRKKSIGKTFDGGNGSATGRGELPGWLSCSDAGAC
jgi:hypothetical protein